MSRRILVWGGLALVLMIAGAVWLLPRWLGSDSARARVEAILTESLGREVTIEALEVETGRPRVELRGVTVAQPPALAVPEEGPLLRAETIVLAVDLETLLRREVIGSAEARGVTLTVLERGGQTSLHGLGRGGNPKEGNKEPPALDLELALLDAAVRLSDLDRKEAIEVRDVRVEGHLSNHPGASPDASPEAVATLTAAAVELRGVALTDLMVQARLQDKAIELVRVRASLGVKGTLEGKGRLGSGAEEPADWSVDLALHDVALDGPLRDLAATVVPAVVRATTSPGAATTGWLDAELSLHGQGLAWSTIEPSLGGRASLSLREVVVPGDLLLLELATLAGRPSGPWSIERVEAAVRLADGWLTPESLVLGELSPKIDGRVSLRGQLDLTVELMPLVEHFGGGVYATVARTTTSVPVRITGTIDEPTLAPPRLRDVAKGLLGGALRRALEPETPDKG